MRVIRFRGRREEGIKGAGNWEYGHYVYGVQYPDSAKSHTINGWPIDPETVGQHTGLKDKKGIDVYEGDVLRWYQLDIEYQTHYGDNIPLGSYTEPCGILCKKFQMPVLFRDALFTCAPSVDPQEEYPNCECPIHYPHHFDRKELNHIFYPRPYGRENEVLSDEDFLDVAKSCAEDFGFECLSIDDFISKINSFEVIGNIYEHPHLIEK